jgi:glycosyltransferase involved in cell wall biosynthesis
MRLLYFSPVFVRSYAQRPHFMVRAWLEHGVKEVLWVDPYPARLPRWQDLRRRKAEFDQGTTLDPRVQALHVPALPIEPLPGGPWLNRRVFAAGAWRRIEQFAAGEHLVVGIGRPGALAHAALRELQPRTSFFDAMDDFPEFHQGISRRSIRYYEDSVAREAQVIFASSSFLAEKFARQGLRVEKAFNACDVSALPLGPPLHQREFILGYVGCLGAWFDWPLVVRLAEQVPDARVELIGPCAVPAPAALPPNIHLGRPCNHSEVAALLGRFRVGLVPFRHTPLTAGVDPIKFYEYRAAGLPVLSTRFGEMASRGPAEGVYALDAAEDLAASVQRALEHVDAPAAIDRFRQENDWQRRWEIVRRIALGTAIGGK